MRVIAGSARRILLKTVEGLETRPTTDRIKETLFNILQPDIPGARVLDLFSGSGETDPTDLGPKGMGLGLHIAQGIARAHGGSLILRSEEGQGTHIRLMLPAKDRLVLRDSAADDRGSMQLLTELAPVLSHRAYRKEYRD